MAKKDITTYPEAASLQNFNAFGFNSETGAGENLPGSKIQEAIDAAGGMFLVTYNSRTGTADKSYTEIATALQSGKSVVLKSISVGGERFYAHTGNDSSGVKFSLVYEGSNGPIIEELTVSSNDVWSETSHQGASKTYVDGTRLQLASVSSASWTGAATASIDLDKLTDFGEVPAAVTGLTVSITEASSPFVSQCAFQFSLAASTTFASLSINLGSTACKIANAPDTWEPGKVYQVTMVNGCAVVGAFA